MSVYALSIINLAFAGHLGKLELAASALGTSLVSIVARIVIMGLCGGLDTQASQVGCGCGRGCRCGCQRVGNWERGDVHAWRAGWFPYDPPWRRPVPDWCMHLTSLAPVLSLSGFVARVFLRPCTLVCVVLHPPCRSVALQAFGAGNLPALGPIFQRSVLFMWAHCIPLSAVLVAVPELLRRGGTDEELATMASRYIIAMVTSVWLDAVARWGGVGGLGWGRGGEG